MQKYRSKKEHSQVVEAVMLTGENAGAVAEWCHGFLVDEYDPLSNKAYYGINIDCVGEMRRASEGNWVIKHGEDFFVGRTSFFVAKYEEMPSGSE